MHFFGKSKFLAGVFGISVMFLSVDGAYAEIILNPEISGGTGGLNTCTQSNPCEIAHLTGSCSSFGPEYISACNSKYYKYKSCLECSSSSLTRQLRYVCGTSGASYYACAGDGTGSGGNSGGSLLPDTNLDLIDCTGKCPVVFNSACSTWVTVSQSLPMGGYEHAYQAKSTCECQYDWSQGVCAWVAKTTKYRCAKGFYGGASCSGTLQASCSGCQPCSSHDGSKGTTTPNDGTTSTTQVQACYKDETISSNDGKGTYVYTTPCYYSAN